MTDTARKVACDHASKDTPKKVKCSHGDRYGCKGCPHFGEHTHHHTCEVECEKKDVRARCVEVTNGGTSDSFAVTCSPSVPPDYANYSDVKTRVGGIDPHQPGVKLDQGKPRVGMWMRCVPMAILEVAKVATFGASKYSDFGCLTVEKGESRYEDAILRHLLEDAIDKDSSDCESGIIHLAHEAWNAMMVLELALRRINAEAKAK